MTMYLVLRTLVCVGHENVNGVSHFRFFLSSSLSLSLSLLFHTLSVHIALRFSNALWIIAHFRQTKAPFYTWDV